MVKLSRKAKISLETLNPGDSEVVQTVLRLLDGRTEQAVPTEKLQLADPTYSATAGRFRIIFAISGDDKTVVDIVDHDRLKAFHQQASLGAHA